MYVPSVALISFSSCSNTVITAAALHYQRQLFSSNWCFRCILASVVCSELPGK